MRSAPIDGSKLSKPLLLREATELISYMKTLQPRQLATAMHVSDKLAASIYAVVKGWNLDPGQQRMAVDSFLGDIYSGLQVAGWSTADRDYADHSLRILSGLYGILRPSDGIHPYRLEMGYKLPDRKYGNLYTYWGNAVANLLPSTGSIVNLAAVEYSKLVTTYVDEARIITPKFLTITPKASEPTFVVVHTKIARGALANWLIRHQIEDSNKLLAFGDLGYKYDASLSTKNRPVFICEQFGGIGLSVRLT
jgi:cytoplasmic iron level regulating protein YaaA (DUF328/UPF0246 family)